MFKTPQNVYYSDWKHLGIKNDEDVIVTFVGHIQWGIKVNADVNDVKTGFTMLLKHVYSNYHVVCICGFENHHFRWSKSTKTVYLPQMELSTTTFPSAKVVVSWQ